MSETTGVDPKAVERGLKTRREVLGDEYVNRATASQTEAQQTFQDMVAGNCWDAVWNREQLSRRERSLMNLAMLAALNRPHEIALHVTGALNNGLQPFEIEEVFLHVMPYCGVPAAIDGMKVARPVLEEWLGTQRKGDRRSSESAEFQELRHGAPPAPRNSQANQ